MSYYVYIDRVNFTNIPDNLEHDGEIFKFSNGEFEIKQHQFKWYEDQFYNRLKEFLKEGLQGAIEMSGEEPHDYFKLILNNNKIIEKAGKVVYKKKGKLVKEIPKLEYKVNQTNGN